MSGQNQQPRLRIAVLIRLYSRVGGGAERYCVELTERLAKTHDVHLFTQSIKTDLPANIELHKIPVWIEKLRFINQWLFSRATGQATRNNFDIVHSHDMVTHADIYTLHVPCVRTVYTRAKGWKKLLLCLETLLSPRKIGYLWLEKLQLSPRKNRQFIAVSELLSRNIVSSYPRIQNQISIAYPGINRSPEKIDNTEKSRRFRQSLEIPESAFLALFVGNEFRRKGLPAILKALHLLDDTDIHLIVAGAEQPDLMKKLASQYKLLNQVHFIGVYKNMDELYAASDLLIHPTLIDTYAMVVLEAMSHALPVIVSNARYCGFTEHLTDKEALILQEPENHEEIAKAIKRLQSEPEFRQKLSKNSRLKASGITWDDTLKQTLKAYQKLLSGTPQTDS